MSLASAAESSDSLVTDVKGQVTRVEAAADGWTGTLGYTHDKNGAVKTVNATLGTSAALGLHDRVTDRPHTAHPAGRTRIAPPHLQAMHTQNPSLSKRCPISVPAGQVSQPPPPSQVVVPPLTW